MPVYVDDMNAPYGRMVMCHMVADTDEELHAMAAKIGVARRWHQKTGTVHSHYDICLAKKALALQHGAQAITQRETGLLIRKKRQSLTMAQSRLESVYWICHGLEPFETREALTLERLRKAQLVVPNVGVFDVTSAARINGQLVARCWPAKPPKAVT